MYTLIVNQDKPNVYINFVRIQKEICEVCKGDMSRTYVRENKQFIPLGWHCPRCKLQRDSIEIAAKTHPVSHEPTKEGDLATELAIMTAERNEFKEISERLMEAHPERTFQNASLMRNDSLTVNTTWNVIEDIKFPADKLSKFFLGSNKCKEFMTLKIEGGKVVGWESN